MIYSLDVKPIFISFDELDEALQSYIDKGRYSSLSIIISFILREFWDKNKLTFTSEEITNRANELIAGYALKKLTDKGLLEEKISETGEPVYSIVEKKNDN